MESLSIAPADRKYSTEHEWILPSQDGFATIGITDYAATQLGGVVFIVLPAVGDAFSQNAKFGEIESVKSVSDLVVPVECEIIEVNQALMDDPEIINESPFDAGWMLRVRLNDPSELDGLLTNDAYVAFLTTL
jgi:glycine cleavage system H protein